VVPIPGCSSALAALSVAGDVGADGHGFRFRRLPAGQGRRTPGGAAGGGGRRETQVLFEAPHRIEALAPAWPPAAPQRTLTLWRELTKQFETVFTLPAGEAPAWLAADPNRVRGEFVLVLHALPPAERTEAAADHLRVLLAAPAPGTSAWPVLQRVELPLKQAVALAAEISGAPRNALYQRALQRRDDGPRLTAGRHAVRLRRRTVRVALAGGASLTAWERWRVVLLARMSRLALFSACGAAWRVPSW
jgi:16S rRNA (cytidine1402-2'-O)-methyltransferase